MSHIYLKNNRYLYFINSNRILNAGIKDLFIKHAANKKIEWEDFRIDEYMIKSRIANLHQLIFETSQNCNLKCSYCLYGGSYFHQRKNSSKLLAFDIAAKTIDYIFGVIGKRRKNELIIGFYGGEPLLNFDVIQQIITKPRRISKLTC